MIIYRIVNKINGKTYIGQTSRKLSTRLACHKKAKTYFGSSLRKYGIENFHIEVLDYSKTRLELNEKEEYYISFYNCVAPNGYNIHLGGSAKNMSEHTKKKLSNQRKGSIPYLAIRKAAEIRLKQIKRICIKTNEIKIYRTTHDAAIELNLRTTQIHKCAKYPNKGYTSGGFKWEYIDCNNVTSFEQRTETHWLAKNKVVKLIKNNEIFEFKSQKEAAEFIKTRPQNISRVMTGKRLSIKGYKKC